MMRSLGIGFLFLLYTTAFSISDELSVCYYFPRFQHMELRHIKSIKQQKVGCAWYALCNARAIDELYRDAQSINADSIRTIVTESLFPLLASSRVVLLQAAKINTFGGLISREKHYLAHYLNLSNYYAVALRPERKWLQLYLPEVTNELTPYVDTPHYYKDHYGVKSPKLFFKKLFSRKEITHFLIGAPTLFGESDNHHAVLVTVLWQSGQEKPTVIYMDSNNALLGENPTWLLSPALYLFFKTMDEALAPEKCT